MESSLQVSLLLAPLWREWTFKTNVGWQLMIWRAYKKEKDRKIEHSKFWGHYKSSLGVGVNITKKRG